MSNWRQQVKNNPHFCILPFNHLHLTTEGRSNLCCVADFRRPLYHDTGGMTLDTIWKSEIYKNIRQDMLDGKRVKQCEGCYKQDEMGGGSDRQTHNRWFKPPMDDWDINVETGNTTNNPIWMDLRPGRFCNLGCRMCFVGVSSTVADEHKAHPELTDITGEGWVDVDDWIENPGMYKSLQDMIPHLTAIKLAGGEPLFMPGVIKMLKWCVDTGNTHLRLDITTNGTRTKGKVITWLEKFKSVDIQFSIDGIGETNNYIRWPSEWEVIDYAYRKYSSMQNIKTLNILSTVQLYNVFEIADIIDYWKNNGERDKLVFNFVNWPREMNIDLLPERDRLMVAADIEEKTSDLPDESKQQCRVDALIFRLRQSVTENEELNILRYKFAKRTRKYDELRNQSVGVLHPRIVELVDEWIKIGQKDE